MQPYLYIMAGSGFVGLLVIVIAAIAGMGGLE